MFFLRLHFLSRVKHLGTPEVTHKYVRINHDGVMTWETSAIITVSCAMSMIEFPKDAHKCHIWIGFREQSDGDGVDAVVRFSNESLVYQNDFSLNSSSFSVMSLDVSDEAPISHER